MNTHDPDGAEPARHVVLRYVQGNAAPRLTADIDDVQLEAMRQLAGQNDLPLPTDPALAALLSAIRLQDDIPPSLYAAAAAVLGLIYAIENGE